MLKKIILFFKKKCSVLGWTSQWSSSHKMVVGDIGVRVHEGGALTVSQVRYVVLESASDGLLLSQSAILDTMRRDGRGGGHHL